MLIGKSYRPLEFLYWTRRRVYILIASALLVVGLYQLAGLRWIALPWPVLAMLGTAASFIVGFKNAQTYSRTVEAQQIWSSITAISRYWGLICRDFPVNGAATALVIRHFAWLTAVRYQLRSPRIWEAGARPQDAEYRARLFAVPEHDVPIEAELANYMPRDSVTELLNAGSVPMALIALQSLAIRDMYTRQEIPVLHHTEMQKTLKDLVDQHARSERLKNFPYPRQYAIVNSLFVWAFALLLPLGVVREFGQLGAPGLMQGQMAWLAVPFSVLIGWMYLSLDQVGESTENPFEGSANDVPITTICRGIERELRTMLGEQDLAPLPESGERIVL